MIWNRISALGGLALCAGAWALIAVGGPIVYVLVGLISGLGEALQALKNDFLAEFPSLIHDDIIDFKGRWNAHKDQDDPQLSLPL